MSKGIVVFYFVLGHTWQYSEISSSRQEVREPYLVPGIKHKLAACMQGKHSTRSPIITALKNTIFSQLLEVLYHNY